MADRHVGTGTPTGTPPRSTATSSPSQGNPVTFLGKLNEHAPNSNQLIGVLTLIISGAILLLLSGITITTVVFGLIFFAPLIVISSPIWLPIAVVLFVAVGGFLSICGFFLTVIAAASWLYKYFRGLHPLGSDRFDYARSRIANTASHVRDYAWEYGGYLHGKVKDAAPSA
ncbi:hypothetical protein Nepgr_018925 [Nepenthes gracilis]|uniref:Oleosin n=1 Tax=Nepenthes gracilis TaxID=150966 RepID=A0AAD3XUH7_NEPGR|nr:hypothetical protein Nepgr_018925 [Nepenthes gracilis]